MFGFTVFVFLLPLRALCQDEPTNDAGSSASPPLPPSLEDLAGLISSETFPNFNAFAKSKVSEPFFLNLPDSILSPEKFGINEEARNFPKEAVERGLTEAETKKKRESESDSSSDALPTPDPEPKASSFPTLYDAQTLSALPLPSFPDTDAKVTPLQFPFADPSLKNYPPPAVPSAAVRSLSVRKRRQAFPSFSQVSGSSQNFGNPAFPNTQAEVQSSSINFPDIMSQPFQIPSSIQQQFSRKKRQVGNDFPNFAEFSQSGQPFAGPSFPNTQSLIGDGNFDFIDPQSRGFPQGSPLSGELQRNKRQGRYLVIPGARNTFPNIFNFAQSNSDSPGDSPSKRPKRGHLGRQNALHNVQFFDDMDSLTAPIADEILRPNRNARPQFGPVRYPPYDPFGNIQYIPLPPSNPHFALPVTHEDPHMFPSKKEKFRRPHRNVNLNSLLHLQDVFASPDAENFIYESSTDFNDDKILSALKKLHFR